MASTNEEEVAAMEETAAETGRRSTRSRRSGAAAPATPTPAATRSSRRTKKQEAAVEEVPEEEAPQPVVEDVIMVDSDEPDTKQVMEQLQDLIVPVQDNQSKEADESSSINLFEEFQADTNTQQDEKSSSDKEEPVAIPKECEFIANLAAEEENANSLPSVVDENSASVNAAPEAQLDEEYVSPAAPEPSTLDAVNGDNTEDVTGSSDNALAENVANGLNEDDSKNTDLDAEMVSEDELPQPEQPQVHDAEEVSDDELPGPKLAELPADAEVVSEDELPHTAEKVAPELPKDTDNVSDEELPAAKVDLPADTDNVSDEELPAAKKADLPEDTDNVSDEELPAAKVDLPADTDNVSDDELPVAKKAELPADTDNVSDEELESKSRPNPTPSSPKRPSRATRTRRSLRSESSRKEADAPAEKTGEAPEKKTKVDPPAEPEKKKLPDLDKYWKAVNDDSTDFTAWTYLLQYVDQESDIEAAREAYDAFLAHYPYCYGYWRKYADYEKRKGSKRKCEEVFERGLRAIPLSVDLWIHYLGHVKTSNADDETAIRSQFERALAACGLEFRSDKLWEAYIKWENEGKRVDKVVALYDRLLATPTQGYANHFDHFKEVVNNNGPVHTLVSKEEFLELRAYVRESARKRKEDREKKEKDRKDKHDDHKSSKSKSDKSADKRDKSQEPQEAAKESKEVKELEVKIKEEPMDTDEVKAKEDEKENAKPAEQDKAEEKMEVEAEPEKEADDHVNSPEEADSIKDKIISRRKKVHKATVAAVTARWTYEEGIKRPYFHVKPLERCQLKNWKEYLDFEIEQGDEKRVLVLFERCLIACALYDDFWLKLIRYLDGRAEHQPEMVPRIRDGYERACTIHHPDKPSLHLMWSAFEESQDNIPKAAEILANLEKVCPNLMQIAYRRINLERRRGDHDKCVQLYQSYLAQAKSKTIAGNIAIKYARFLNKIKKDLDQAHTVLKTYLEKDPSNTRVALQLIDLALQRDSVDEKEIVEIMDTFMTREGIEPDQKVLFAQRKVEFLEDFGSTAKGLQEAQKALQAIMAKANEVKKKREQSPPKKASKESSSSAAAGASASSYAAGSYSYAANPSSYYGTAASGYQYGDSSSYGYSTWNQQYSQSGYGNYGQWSGYGSYY
ncbi:hypothetical protein pipiens_015029 [Culex pipiens pipiens]|uniref:Pre-mRNA-processing factor 39 n=1 Tax=Culex pipiens pipiens TaxID=38569 RepID=A0ABD1CS47_CULPP